MVLDLDLGKRGTYGSATEFTTARLALDAESGTTAC